jgi:hypothetical protein
MNPLSPSMPHMPHAPYPIPAARGRLRRRVCLAGAGALLAAALAGCAGPGVADYAAERPRLDLREYFNGRVTAHGIFTDRSGKVTKRFTVTMNCSWQGDVGTLDEDFVYSDGQRQKRVWRLVRGDGGSYSGSAADVVGEAQGQAAGNAFNWRYTLALPVSGRVYEVQFDDWMYLMDGTTMLNRAVMSKFGVGLGELTLAFTKG